MPANDDRVGPTGNKARDIFDYDRLAKDNATKNIADRSIWRFPHFLQAEFFDARFIWCNRCAFHANTKFANGVGGFDGDLVIGLVTMFHAKIIIFQVNVEIRQNQTLAYPLPDDASHFVAIEFNDRIFDLNFCHG